tara:strand:- start:3989 stop:4129 length:141 start_codon:yes stop_codon:yes gene_type:complete
MIFTLQLVVGVVVLAIIFVLLVLWILKLVDRKLERDINKEGGLIDA